jgi:hypothetical protein
MKARDAEDDYTLQVMTGTVHGIRYSTSRSPHLDKSATISQRYMGLSSCLSGSEVRTLDTDTTVAVMLFHLEHVFLDSKQGKLQNKSGYSSSVSEFLHVFSSNISQYSDKELQDTEQTDTRETEGNT